MIFTFSFLYFRGKLALKVGGAGDKDHKKQIVFTLVSNQFKRQHKLQKFPKIKIQSKFLYLGFYLCLKSAYFRALISDTGWVVLFKVLYVLQFSPVMAYLLEAFFKSVSIRFYCSLPWIWEMLMFPTKYSNFSYICQYCNQRVCVQEGFVYIQILSMFRKVLPILRIKEKLRVSQFTKI